MRPYFCTLLMLIAPATIIADQKEHFTGAMEKELQRSMRLLKLENFRPPYFIAYRLRRSENDYIEAANGSIVRPDHGHRSAAVAVELRVGSYDFDNRSILKKKASYGRSYNTSSPVPYEFNELSVRKQLWLLTDALYRDALSVYHMKKAQKAFETEKKGKPNFALSREKPVVHFEKIPRLDKFTAAFEEAIKETSNLLNDEKEIVNGNVTISGHVDEDYLVTSEGTRLRKYSRLYSLAIWAKTTTPTGELLDDSEVFYARSLRGLPAKREMMARTRELIKYLGELRRAPKMDPYVGPAILMPQAAGVLFHEALGHRLEGERQLSGREGRTFADKIGKPIAPDFLSLFDDPTMTNFKSSTVNGHYRYDEEGIAVQRVVLVDKGNLRSFLMSRTPVSPFLQSNGHGRAQNLWNLPQARMGVTIAEASRAVSELKLRKMLIKEVKKQKKPFGLIFYGTFGGETNTSNYNVQALKGVPRKVYRYYPDGKLELVRGVELIGTPMVVVDSILAAGDQVEIFNGYCGAESGSIPVSAISPAILVRTIELQRAKPSRQQTPILPKPSLR